MKTTAFLLALAAGAAQAQFDAARGDQILDGRLYCGNAVNCQVNADIALPGVKVWARAGQAGPERGDLGSSLQTQVGKALPFDAPSLSGRTLTLPDPRGQDPSNDIELPTVCATQPTLSAGTWNVQVHAGDCRLVSPAAAAGVRDFALSDTEDPAARSDLVTLMDGAAADAERLDYHDLKRRPDTQIEANRAFIDSLESDTTLASRVSIANPTTNTWRGVVDGNGDPVTLPAARAGVALEIRVELTGETTADQEISLAELRALGTGGTIGQAIGTDGIQFSNPPGSRRYRIWWATGTEQLLFSSDEGGIAHTLTVVEAVPDVGLTLQNAGTTVGTAGRITQVNVTGTGCTASATGSNATLSCTGGGGTADHLPAFATLPAVGGYTLGDMIAHADAPWFLATGDTDPHVYHGVIGVLKGTADAPTEIGDATFYWDETAETVSFRPRADQIGTVQADLDSPLTIEVVIPGHHGLYSETSLTLATGQPANRTGAARWEYNRTAGDPDLDVVAEWVGRPFSVAFYSDAAKQDPVRVVASTNRWIRGSGGGAAGGEQSNLALGTRTATTVPVTNDHGTGVVLPQATTTLAGVLGAADKTKLDAYPATPQQPSTIPQGTSFPAQPGGPPRFRLLRPETIAVDPLATMRFAQDDAGSDRILRLPLLEGHASGPFQIVGYASDYDGSTPAIETALRGKVFVQYSGAPGNHVLNRIWLYEDGHTSASYVVSTTALTTRGLNHFYEVTGLTFANLEAGNWHRNGQYNDDGAKVFPDVQEPVGDFSWTAATGWVFTPGIAAGWATQGQPDPRIPLPVTRLISGPGIGESYSDTSLTLQTSAALRLYTPAFNLVDTTPTPDVVQAGLLTLEARVTMTAASAANVGFAPSSQSTNPNRTGTITGFTFAGTLEDATAFAANARNGVQVGSLPIYGGTTKLGDLFLYQAYSGTTAKPAGYYWALPALASPNPTFTFGVDMTGAFLHNERQAASGTLSGITVQDSGTTRGTAGTVDTINFNTNLAATRTGNTVTVNGGAGGGLTVQNSGTGLGTAGTVDTINFTDNLAPTRSGNTVSLAGTTGGSEVLLVAASRRTTLSSPTVQGVALTAAEGRRYGTIQLIWGSWAANNEIRFPHPGTWCVVSWSNNVNIVYRGHAANRQTVTAPSGAHFCINNSDGGDVRVIGAASVTRSATAVTLSTGSATRTSNGVGTVNIPTASTTLAGVLTAADKGKLDGLPSAFQIRSGTGTVASGTAGTFQNYTFSTAFTGAGVPVVVASDSRGGTLGMPVSVSNTGFSMARHASVTGNFSYIAVKQ